MQGVSVRMARHCLPRRGLTIGSHSRNIRINLPILQLPQKQWSQLRHAHCQAAVSSRHRNNLHPPIHSTEKCVRIHYRAVYQIHGGYADPQPIGMITKYAYMHACIHAVSVAGGMVLQTRCICSIIFTVFHGQRSPVLALIAELMVAGHRNAGNCSRRWFSSVRRRAFFVAPDDKSRSVWQRGRLSHGVCQCTLGSK